MSYAAAAAVLQQRYSSTALQPQHAARTQSLLPHTAAATWRRLQSCRQLVVYSSSSSSSSSTGGGSRRGRNNGSGVEALASHTAVAAAAATPAGAALLSTGARCPYPSSPAGQRMLEAALPDIVRNLSRAPFVLVSSGSKREVVTVPHSIAAASHQEVWRDVAPSLEARRPEMYVFVHEVPEDDVFAAQPAGASSSAATAAGEGGEWRGASAAVKQCSERLPLAGRLGDCCDGEAGGASHSHHTSDSHASNSSSSGGGGDSGGGGSLAARHDNQGQHAHGHQQQQQQQRTAPRLPTPRKGCLETRKAWGLVVRTHDADHPVAGCYLLTTVQNSDPTGCTCVHFSATRVCQGESLYNQLVRSWLVTA